MPETEHNWCRYWCPRDGKLQLSPGGYLLDQDALGGLDVRLDIAPVDLLGRARCVILLGEPGIGKSHVFQSAYELARTRDADEHGTACYHNLHLFGDESRLIQEIFCEPETAAALAGNGRALVFLDSLDECMTRIRQVVSILIDRLRRHPLHNIQLRMACRTADWPHHLEDELTSACGDEDIDVWELAPLRRVDVAEAARAYDIDDEGFLTAIEERGVVPLATKPATLRFMISKFTADGSFSSTQAELYRSGLVRLCDEIDPRRRGTGSPVRLDADQRLAVAGRIAAMTMLCRRTAAFTDVDLGECLANDLQVAEIAGDGEQVRGNRLDVTEAAVRETLGTAIFTSRGPGRLGFAHHTYGEYLAANYLEGRNLPLDQILGLFVAPDDPGGRIIPQLQETASWLAIARRDFFEYLIRHDPQVLLRSDVAATNHADRARLVHALLDACGTDDLPGLKVDDYRHLRKLAYPAVSGDLDPVIQNDAGRTEARRLAIDIAEATQAEQSVAACLDIALDAQEDLSIRSRGASVVVELGDDAVKTALRPLLDTPNDIDASDELKGYALTALWPNHLNATELFGLLSPPKNQSLFGQYKMFLHYRLLNGLRPDDLPIALEWAAEQPPGHCLPRALGKLADGIMRVAWDHLETPGVLDCFAAAALNRFDHLDSIWGHLDETDSPEFRGDTVKRRAAVGSMVAQVTEPTRIHRWMIAPGESLITQDDIEWYGEQILSAEQDQHKKTWIEVLKHVLNLTIPRHLNLLLRLATECSAVADEFHRWITPIALDSDEARKERAEWLKYQEMFKKDEPTLLVPPPAERIEACLQAVESGDLDSFWKLNMALTLEETSTHYGDGLNPSIDKLPGWITAGEEIRVRIIHAALDYVRQFRTETTEWLGTNKIYEPVFSGYRAIALLYSQSTGHFSQIAADDWAAWAPIVVGFPAANQDEVEVQEEIIAAAYSAAADAVVDSVMQLADIENVEHGSIWITSRLERIECDRLNERLLAKSRDDSLSPASRASLLTFLCARRHRSASEYARRLVVEHPPEDTSPGALGILAARLLVVHDSRAGWPEVWNLMRASEAAGRLIAKGAAQIERREAANLGSALTEEELAELFIWLETQFPHGEDPRIDGPHSPGEREIVGHWRDSLLGYLKTRGTRTACAQLTRIQLTFPDLEFLKWTIHEALDIARRNSWLPPSPQHLLALFSRRDHRLVSDGMGLLDVLEESLKRLEARLQGETPAAPDLWDERARGRFRPKDENALSNYIKRFLDEDLRGRGIIVNREVQIRRGEGDGQGEQTDVHVDAIVRGHDGATVDCVTAIVEVKGYWHPELETAMESQLVGRYLRDNQCSHGMYLVGWFHCGQWNAEDDRRRRAPQYNLAAARERFEDQASGLSDGGLNIRSLVLNCTLR